MGCAASTELPVVSLRLKDIHEIGKICEEQLDENVSLKFALPTSFAVKESADTQSAAAFDALCDQVFNDLTAVNTLPNAPPKVSDWALKTLITEYRRQVLEKCIAKLETPLRATVRVKEGESHDDVIKKKITQSAIEHGTNAVCTRLLVTRMSANSPRFQPSKSRAIDPTDVKVAVVEPAAAPAPAAGPAPEAKPADNSSVAAASPAPAAAPAAAPPASESTSASAATATSSSDQKPAAATSTAAAPVENHAASPSKDSAAPTDEELAYPLPDGKWTKCEDDSKFYFSDTEGLFFFPAAGHFFDPNSGQWFVPDTEQWLDEAAHDKVLEDMAAKGLY